MEADWTFPWLVESNAREEQISTDRSSLSNEYNNVDRLRNDIAWNEAAKL